MFRNYLKTAFRNLLRYKGFSIINIASLTIGVVGCLIIGLFVWDEKQYDQFQDAGQVFRVYEKRSTEQGMVDMAMVPPALAPYAQQQFPEVEQTLRILNIPNKVLVETGNIKAYEDKGFMAENSFFNFFPLRFLKGDPATALKEKNTVVITEDMAKKFFGAADPIGKTVIIDDPYIVTGVVKNVPEHFHLDFHYILSLSSLTVPQERMQRWTWHQFFTYIKLKKGSNIQAFQHKFQSAIDAQLNRDAKESGQSFAAFLQPLKDIHLKSADFMWDIARRGNITYVKALSIIALFVLVIACFNFVNLATARSLRRAKEIGVRKVIGAERTQLMLQFTGETILLSVIAVLMAGIITMLLIPPLNNFTGKSISFNFFTHPLLALMLIVVGIVIGIIAGIYPAVVLSGFQPVKVLKGLKITNTNYGQGLLREALVVIQFALSALLIICTLSVYRQVKFLHKKDLGFNKEQIITFQFRQGLDSNLASFKTELLRSPDIVSATAGYGLPGDIFATDQVTIPKDGDKKYPTSLFLVDEDYIPTLGLHVLAGRNFSKDFSTDKDHAFILNETAVKEFGFGTPQQALGQKLNWEKWEKDSLNPVKKGEVVGVVKDFHYKSLHEKVAPLVMQLLPEYYKMAVKVKTAELDKAVAFIKATWSKYVGAPLDYSFLDESFDTMYKAEDKLGSLLLIFTIMAILIGCMGLFGLAAFSAEQRIKEIGIRKVLGASVFNITAMLSKSFVRMVLIASVIAFPIAWWAMNKWLEDFAYRTNISWWIFIAAGVLAIAVALITVSFQAIKAAIANPVKSLRTE